MGYFFGTVFGHGTLAAAWTAFGPLPLLWRLPLALLWMLALTVGAAVNLTLYDGPETFGAVALGLAGQFVFLQLPFWVLALTTGRRLRFYDASAFRSDPRETQFGIRQLMIFTTIVAVVLGVGRVAILQLSQDSVYPGGQTIMVFLAVAAVVVTLPLILAALLPSFAAPAVALVLLLIGVVTVSEVPLLESIHGGGGPDTFHIVFINSITSAWILAVVLLARVSGYRFGKPGAGVPA